MALTRIDFPVLARGMNREAPVGTLNPQAVEGPLWRELVNLVPHEGELRRREAVVEIAGGAPTFLDSRDQAVVGLFRVIPDNSLVGTGRWLLVTQHEMFIGTFGSWTNITPRYSTGTVSINNGTAALTGVGTSWKTRGIITTQQVLLSGSWYQISSVNSDTSITLATNYSGANLVGAAYQIRRTFALEETQRVFVANINNDLYVGGMISSGQVIGVGIDTADGGVLVVTAGADPLATVTSAQVGFMTSGANAVASGVDNLGYNIREVQGMQALPDGRLVLLVHWYNLSGPQSGTNRVVYSSLTNLAVWTTSPGGFTDVTGYRGAGTALTSAGRGVFVHFHDGIEVGDLTGAQDPPLRFRRSDAGVGAVGPSFIQRIPGGRALSPGDVFIGADGAIYNFNGGDAQSVTWASAKTYLASAKLEPVSGSVPVGFSRLDAFREYVSFFVYQTTYTLELRLYYDSGDFATCQYSLCHLTTASAPMDERVGTSEGPISGYFGTYRLNSSAGATNLLYEIRDDEFIDELPNTTGGGTSTNVRAISDALMAPSRRWAVSHIEVHAVREVASATNLAVRLLYDDGAQTEEEIAVAATGTIGREAAYVFYPQTHRSARRIQLRLGAEVFGVSDEQNPFGFSLTRATIWLADVGEARTG